MVIAQRTLIIMLVVALPATRPISMPFGAMTDGLAKRRSRWHRRPTIPRRAHAGGCGRHVEHTLCVALCNWRRERPPRMLAPARSGSTTYALDPVYGLPALAALLLALAYVRRIARRGRFQRRGRRSLGGDRGYRSLSQRSEMRAGEDATTVMEDIARARTVSRRPQANLPPATDSRRSDRKRR